MSLRMGDYLDLERVATQYFTAAVTTGSRGAWNEGVAMLSRFPAYDAEARAAVAETCGYLKGP
jgi:hypothetical protein